MHVQHHPCHTPFHCSLQGSPIGVLSTIGTTKDRTIPEALRLYRGHLHILHCVICLNLIPSFTYSPVLWYTWKYIPYPCFG
jgi:hypothetical protein